MEFGFGVVHRSGKYQKATDAMSKMPLGKEKESADVKDNLSTYCFVGRINKPKTGLKKNEEKEEPLPTTKKLMRTQGNDALSSNHKEMLMKDGTISINENELACKKAPTDGTIQIIVSECYGKNILYHGHSPTLAGHSETMRMKDVLR